MAIKPILFNEMCGKSSLNAAKSRRECENMRKKWKNRRGIMERRNLLKKLNCILENQIAVMDYLSVYTTYEVSAKTDKYKKQLEDRMDKTKGLLEGGEG